MPHLYTTLGALPREKLGMILPHEHVFVDLRTPDVPGYAQGEAEDVVRLMAPEIEKIKAHGVTALVECTTGGVGRRADLDLAVSQATNFPIVVPTGNYREPWIPDWVGKASQDELASWMLRELTQHFDEAPFRAGWIKISAGDEGITELEGKILRAAVAASSATNAVIGSHTIKGRVVMDQLDIIESEGGDPSRFISIHTQLEPDFELHRAVADRGAWIEYDNVGRNPDEVLVEMIFRALDAGLLGQLLLSHDRGFYDPAKPGGGSPEPYTHLNESLMPALRDAGLGEPEIHRLTHDNPFNAFAR
jgi:phosphotriesterase-related protein